MTNNTEGVLSYDFLRSFIRSNEWTPAKTMANIPHEYIVKFKIPYSHDDFWNVAFYIRQFGKREKFFNRSYIYLYFDDYKYWTMGNSKEITKVINRAKISEEPMGRNAFDNSILDLCKSYGFFENRVLELLPGRGSYIVDVPIEPSNYLGLEPFSKWADIFIQKAPKFAASIAIGRPADFRINTAFGNVICFQGGRHHATPSLLAGFLKKWGKDKKFNYFLTFPNTPKMATQLIEIFGHQSIYVHEPYLIVSNKILSQ